MSKFLLVSLLLALSSQAHADYRDSYNLQRLCRAHGNVAGDAFEDRQARKPLSEALAGLDDNHPSVAVIKKVYVSNYASKEDAYMSAWSRCMDDHPNN